MVVLSYGQQKYGPVARCTRFQTHFDNVEIYLRLTKIIFELFKGYIFRIRKKIHVTYLQNCSVISRNHLKTAYVKFGAYFEGLQSYGKQIKPSQITQINSKPCQVSGKIDFIHSECSVVSYGPGGNHSKCANPSKTEFGAYFVGLQYDGRSSNTSEINQNSQKPCHLSEKINSNHSNITRIP